MMRYAMMMHIVDALMNDEGFPKDEHMKHLFRREVESKNLTVAADPAFEITYSQDVLQPWLYAGRIVGEVTA